MLLHLAMGSISITKRTNQSTKNVEPINKINDANSDNNHNSTSSKIANGRLESPAELQQQQHLNHPQQCDEAAGTSIMSAQSFASSALSNQSRKDDSSCADISSLETSSKDQPKNKTSTASECHKSNELCKCAAWDSCAELAAVKGAIDPSKSFLDKNGKQIPPGKAAMCEVRDWGKNERNKKHLLLRQPYHDSSWLDCASTLAVNDNIKAHHKGLTHHAAPEGSPRTCLQEA